MRVCACVCVFGLDRCLLHVRIRPHGLLPQSKLKDANKPQSAGSNHGAPLQYLERWGERPTHHTIWLMFFCATLVGRVGASGGAGGRGAQQRQQKQQQRQPTNAELLKQSQSYALLSSDDEMDGGGGASGSLKVGRACMKPVAFAGASHCRSVSVGVI